MNEIELVEELVEKGFNVEIRKTLEGDGLGNGKHVAFAYKENRGFKQSSSSVSKALLGVLNMIRSNDGETIIQPAARVQDKKDIFS